MSVLWFHEHISRNCEFNNIFSESLRSAIAKVTHLRFSATSLAWKEKLTDFKWGPKNIRTALFVYWCPVLILNFCLSEFNFIFSSRAKYKCKFLTYLSSTSFQTFSCSILELENTQMNQQTLTLPFIFVLFWSASVGMFSPVWEFLRKIKEVQPQSALKLVLEFLGWNSTVRIKQWITSWFLWLQVMNSFASAPCRRLHREW